jgi:hypothetical protein
MQSARPELQIKLDEGENYAIIDRLQKTAQLTTRAGSRSMGCASNMPMASSLARRQYDAVVVLLRSRHGGAEAHSNGLPA